MIWFSLPKQIQQVLFTTNRFKGLDLIDRVPEELWMEVSDIIQETGIKSMSFLVAFSVFSINTKYFSFNCPDL